MPLSPYIAFNHTQAEDGLSFHGLLIEVRRVSIEVFPEEVIVLPPLSALLHSRRAYAPRSRIPPSCVTPLHEEARKNRRWDVCYMTPARGGLARRYIYVSKSPRRSHSPMRIGS
jgi:hypothetical protein